LAVRSGAHSKKCQRFPFLLEEPDFQPGAMVEEIGQPMEVQEFNVNWERVGKKEERGKGCTPGEKGTSYPGAGSEWKGC